MVVRILNKTGRIDPKSLRPQSRPLPSGQRCRHGRTDLSIGRHHPVPRQSLRFLRSQPRQHKCHVPGLHIHVGGDGPVGGEPPSGTRATRRRTSARIRANAWDLGLAMRRTTPDPIPKSNPIHPLRGGGILPG